MNPEHHDHIGALDGLLQGIDRFDPQLLHLDRHHGPGSRQRHLGPHLVEKMDVGPYDSTVLDVTDDRDFEAVEPALVLHDGQGIEKGLRGMLVRSVTGVDDTGRKPFCEHVRHAGMAVADDDQIRRHRLQIESRVHQTLAL